MASVFEPDDGGEPQKRRRGEPAADFPYKSWFAQETKFVVDESNPSETRVAWVVHVARLEGVELARPRKPLTAEENDAFKRFHAVLNPDRPEIAERSVYTDRAREIYRMGLPEVLEAKWITALATEWHCSRPAVIYRQSRRELREMMLADESQTDIRLANEYRHSGGFQTVELFRKWTGRRVEVPHRLTAQPFPSDMGPGELLEYFDSGHTPVRAEQAPGRWCGMYPRLYRGITRHREVAIHVRDEEAGGRTPYGTMGLVSEQQLFYHDLARGPRARAGAPAGLPPEGDIGDQAHFLEENDLMGVATDYVRHPGEILQVARSMFDERKGTPGIHTQESIRQSNRLVDAIYRAPRSRTPLLLTRFQSTFAGWEDLGGYFDAVGTGKAADAARLPGQWRTSTSILSTSYDAQSTFERQAALYIIYHLRSDCAWLWIANDEETEILLPPGLQMRAVRAAATHEIQSNRHVYVLEVLVRPGVRVESYDLAPAPEDTKSTP